MASNAHRNTMCVDHTTLATELAEGAGKCMPTIGKTREDTGRPACGPERSWPPDKVTSRITMSMPKVDPDDLMARLYYFPSRRFDPNPTALCMSGTTPSQRKKNAIASQPWVEPLVSRHHRIIIICIIIAIGDDTYTARATVAAVAASITEVGQSVVNAATI